MQVPRTPALARENQTFAVRCPAAVLALMMAVRPRRAKMTIVLAAPSCLPRLAFCRRKRARAAYSPRLATTVTPPALLGLLTRSAGFAGQPRAPPILI